MVFHYFDSNGSSGKFERKLSQRGGIPGKTFERDKRSLCAAIGQFGGFFSGVRPVAVYEIVFLLERQTEIERILLKRGDFVPAAAAGEPARHGRGDEKIGRFAAVDKVDRLRRNRVGR